MLVLISFNEKGSTEWISVLSENPSAVRSCSCLSSDLHCARGWGQEKFHIKFSWVCIFAFCTLRYQSVLILTQKQKIGFSFGEVLSASQIFHGSKCPCLRRSLSWLSFCLVPKNKPLSVQTQCFKVVLCSRISAFYSHWYIHLGKHGLSTTVGVLFGSKILNPQN